jgi:hypothetical protein
MEAQKDQTPAKQKELEVVNINDSFELRLENPQGKVQSDNKELIELLTQKLNQHILETENQAADTWYD